MGYLLSVCWHSCTTFPVQTGSATLTSTAGGFIQWTARQLIYTDAVYIRWWKKYTIIFLSKCSNTTVEIHLNPTFKTFFEVKVNKL